MRWTLISRKSLCFHIPNLNIAPVLSLTMLEKEMLVVSFELSTPPITVATYDIDLKDLVVLY